MRVSAPFITMGAHRTAPLALRRLTLNWLAQLGVTTTTERVETEERAEDGRDSSAEAVGCRREAEGSRGEDEPQGTVGRASAGVGGLASTIHSCLSL